MNALSKATHLRVIAAHMLNAEPIREEIMPAPRYVRRARNRASDRFWFVPWLSAVALFTAILWGFL